MNTSRTDAMRALERYRDATLMPESWVVLRLDGRGFSRLTEQHFEKPFDAGFRDRMVDAARDVLSDLEGTLAFTQSDEISVLLPPSFNRFGRRHEKLVSVSAAVASASFSAAWGRAVCFDCRVWVGPSEDRVLDYFGWRQDDGARCALQTAAYWTLRNAGASAAQATARLRGAGVREKNELLFERGLNFGASPLWQRRGVLLFRERYLKRGFDPVREVEVEVERSRIATDLELPMKDAFRERLARLLHEAHVG